MPNLRDIRRRLRVVENIKKITDAMERMAAARLRKAQAKAENSRPYFLKLKEILENLAASEIRHPLFSKRDVKRTGLIIISADRGLSGSYNSNILAASERFLKKHTRDNVELIIFGRKALEYYRNKHWEIAFKKQDWGGKFTHQDVENFTQETVSWFVAGKYDEIWLIYTHYISLLKKEVITEKFFSIESAKREGKSSLNYIFEPNPEEILTELMRRYTVARLQTAFDEAYAAELAARVVAMQTASTNSENMIHDLTLLRNKVRQEGITKEIIEISTGAG